MSGDPLDHSNTRWTRLAQHVTLLRAAVVLVVLGIVVLASVGYLRAREAESEYREAVRQIEEIQSLAASDEIYSLTQEDMAWLENEFLILQERIDHIQDLANLPLGVGNAPWVSDRYNAAMDTLEVGRMLAESGQVIAGVGEEALRALDDTGIRAEPGNDGDTWLDVLQRRESELEAALAKMDDAAEKRAEIDEAYLPSGIQFRLQQIDSLMEEFSNQRELADDLPLAFSALGADDTVRYLVLFQNPAELRPTGGFIGTIALVEIERGQILGYEFHDVYDISIDYQENMTEPIDPPWAIKHYVRPDALQYQDANWWPHFPITAETITSMTAAAGWPEVDSVVAAQPEAITELIAITGPIHVNVDGETREITQTNLHDEAERQRRLEREGGETETGHKEVVSLIGEVLLDHLAEGDRDDMVDAAFLMFDALDRRDMQAYHSDDEVQAFLEERNWAGLIEPDPQVRTLAPVFANVTGLKTSLVMQPALHLELLEPDSAGVTEAILTITLDHFGAAEGDPFYEGVQQWWVDVILPDGAFVVESVPDSADDPDSSNGGAFDIRLDVGEREEIAIRFSMPETDRLLLRRQPGLLNMDILIEQPDCDDPLQFDLDRDSIVSVDGQCPALEQMDEDAYSS